MKSINTKKLSDEINDTLIHRQCVMRSGAYLAEELIKANRGTDAIRLIRRCQVHDISKITDADEFMALASVVDTIGELKDISYSPNKDVEEARSVHWKRNSHHPEYYESPNDMSDLDLMEMACDCHARSKQFGTNLLEYIKVQQQKRFHFDREHLRKLMIYCTALVEKTVNDDYSDLLNPEIHLSFEFKDSTLAKLEVFDDNVYPDTIKSERLYLQKDYNSDFASVVYIIYTKDEHNKVGEISVKFNGFLEYNVYQSYIGQGYTSEAVRAVIDNSQLREIYLSIRKDNDKAMEMASRLGFEGSYSTESSRVYCLKPPKKA